MSMIQKASVARISEKFAFVDRFHQPEYTGENRCTPCTLVNLVLALIGSIAGFGLVRAVGTTRSFAVAIAVGWLLVSIATIYLRGYLVPYTPTLTKRYFPDRVLRWFEKQPSRDRSIEEPMELDVEQFLLENDLLTECTAVEDWCLEASFQDRWYAAMDDYGDQRARETAIADLLSVEPDRLTVLEYGSAAAVKVDGREVGQWESGAALLADLAADAVLAETNPDWSSLHPVNRSQVLSSLRMFLEVCPDCGAALALGQETVDSCCRTFEVVAVTCESCGARVFELEADHLPAG